MIDRDIDFMHIFQEKQRLEDEARRRMMEEEGQYTVIYNGYKFKHKKYGKKKTIKVIQCHQCFYNFILYLGTQEVYNNYIILMCPVYFQMREEDYNKQRKKRCDRFFLGIILL